MSNKKKDSLVHFPFYCHQYLSILNRYDFQQQGAFIRVVAVLIAEDFDCPKPNENQLVFYRFFSAFTDEERKAIDIVFNEAEKLAKEISIAQKSKRQTYRHNGSLGGRPKKQQVNQADNQQVNQKGNQNKTYTEIEYINKESIISDEIIPKKKSRVNNFYNLNAKLEELGIDKTLWDQYVEVRQEKKRVFTVAAMKLTLEKLQKFKEKGLNPSESLKDSIEGGWQGVFEPKSSQSKSNNQLKVGVAFS